MARTALLPSAASAACAACAGSASAAVRTALAPLVSIDTVTCAGEAAGLVPVRPSKTLARPAAANVAAVMRRTPREAGEDTRSRAMDRSWGSPVLTGVAQSARHGPSSARLYRILAEC